MKKKLLLIALPALMVLSGCSNPNKPVEKVENNSAEMMVEDNLAHEDIFGGVAVKSTSIKQMNPVDNQTPYKIGYQLHYDDGAGMLSIRFIAAITQSYSSMVWSRGLSRGDGSTPKAYGNTKRVAEEDIPLVSTVTYTSLANGEEDEMAANTGIYSGYQYFIVYSLTDIPYEAYKDSYIAVSLTLHPTAGDDVVTPIYAVKIETNNTHTESIHKFRFNPDVNTYNGYFLQGTINDTEQVYPADNPTVGDNNASYTNLDLLTTDSFASFYFKDSVFKYFSCEQHDYAGGGDEWSYFDESSSLFNTVSGGFVAPKESEEYALFVSKGNANHVYSMIYGQNTRYTCYNLPGWVGSGVDLFASVQYSDSSWHWVSASMSDGNMVFDAPNTALKFLLVRCKTGTTTPNWSTTGDNVGRIYNQTGDISVSFGTYSYEASIWSDYNP